jgi:hypothetical protein
MIGGRLRDRRPYRLLHLHLHPALCSRTKLPVIPPPPPLLQHRAGHHSNHRRAPHSCSTEPFRMSPLEHRTREPPRVSCGRLLLEKTLLNGKSRVLTPSPTKIFVLRPFPLFLLPRKIPTPAHRVHGCSKCQKTFRLPPAVEMRCDFERRLTRPKSPTDRQGRQLRAVAAPTRVQLVRGDRRISCTRLRDD